MKVFGHRGAPGSPRHGENTIRSFHKALERGAHGVEFDVRRCGDGTIVVIHDHTVDRTTGGSGRVADFSYEQLRQLDAGFGEPIPRLADVLEVFGGRCVLNIELKETGLAAEVRSLVAGAGCAANVIVSAFDADDNDTESNSTWGELPLLAPEIPIALLATSRKLSRIGIDGFISHARRLGAAALHPHRRAHVLSLLDGASAAGLRVHVWTVNDPAEILRFREIGVDAVFTDFPDPADG